MYSVLINKTLSMFEYFTDNDQLDQYSMSVLVIDSVYLDSIL